MDALQTRASLSLHTPAIHRTVYTHTVSTIIWSCLHVAVGSSIHCSFLHWGPAPHCGVPAALEGGIHVRMNLDHRHKFPWHVLKKLPFVEEFSSIRFVCVLAAFEEGFIHWEKRFACCIGRRDLNLDLQHKWFWIRFVYVSAAFEGGFLFWRKDDKDWNPSRLCMWLLPGKKGFLLKEKLESGPDLHTCVESGPQAQVS